VKRTPLHRDVGTAGRCVTLAAVVVLAAACPSPTPLTIAHVAAPAVNCVFNPACKVTVTDTIGNIPLPGIAGQAVLQSRTYDGVAGAPAAGLTAYEYRVDLTQAAGIVNIPCVDALKVDFGPVVSTLHYSGGPNPEQVYVITQGGLGSIAPVAAEQSGRIITFTFKPSVCAGSAPGKGDTSYFFGLAATNPPQAITAQVVSAGATLAVPARAPKP
jgi:hypothetical protein